MLNRRLFAAALAAALTLAAVPSCQAADKLTVFAAASLKNALDAVGAAWSKETGQQAVISYAASSALAKQIEAGAPADIYMSADREWMAYLAERDGIVAETVVELLGNEIVLVAAPGIDAATTIENDVPLASLLGDGPRSMAD